MFVPRYESLKLSHATNYLMESEDTVEDPLMSFQFYINSKSFFHFVLQSIYCFHFYCKRQTLESVFLPRYESLKLNHDTNYLMLSEDKVVDPLMGVQFNIKSNSFFQFVLKSIYCFFCKRRLNLYLYHAMNL